MDLDVENGVLYVDPFLPDWLPELRSEGILVGEQLVDVHFWREDGETQVELLRGDGVRLARRPFMQAADPGWVPTRRG